MSDPNWQRMYLMALQRHHDNLDAILGVIAVGGDLRGVVLTIVDWLDGMDALGEPEDEFRALLLRAWLAAGGEPDTFPIRDVVAESMPHRIDCSRPGDCDCEPVDSEGGDHRLAQVPGGHPVVLPVRLQLLQEHMRLAVEVDDMAEACIADPGLVTRPEFDEFVARMRAVSEDLARVFVQRVYAGLVEAGVER